MGVVKYEAARALKTSYSSRSIVPLKSSVENQINLYHSIIKPVSLYTIVQINWQVDLNVSKKAPPPRKSPKWGPWPLWPLYFLKAYEKCRFRFLFWKGLRRPGAAQGQKIIFFKKICWIFLIPKIDSGSLCDP